MKEQLEEAGKKLILLETKKSDNKIILDFGVFKLKIFPETYSDFNFVPGNVYNSEFINQIIFVNKKNEIVRYICQKANKKLLCFYDAKLIIQKKFSDANLDAIEAALNQLSNYSFINDKYYVKQIVEFFDSHYYGKYYIDRFLRNKEISKEILDNINYLEEAEKEKAKIYFSLIKNKFVSKNIALQKKKIYESLLKRGFGNDIATDLINSLNFDEDIEFKNLQKEYKKIKRKFFGEKELTEMDYSKLISILIEKGYEYTKVEEIIEKDKRGEINYD